MGNKLYTTHAADKQNKLTSYASSKFLIGMRYRATSVAKNANKNKIMMMIYTKPHFQINEGCNAS